MSVFTHHKRWNQGVEGDSHHKALIKSIQGEIYRIQCRLDHIEMFQTIRENENGGTPLPLRPWHTEWLRSKERREQQLARVMLDSSPPRGLPLQRIALTYAGEDDAMLQLYDKSYGFEGKVSD
jgi:hypothetical protein